MGSRTAFNWTWRLTLAIEETTAHIRPMQKANHGTVCTCTNSTLEDWHAGNTPTNHGVLERESASTEQFVAGVACK